MILGRTVRAVVCGVLVAGLELPPATAAPATPNSIDAGRREAVAAPVGAGEVRNVDSDGRVVRHVTAEGVQDIFYPDPPESSATCPRPGQVGEIVYRSAQVDGRTVDPCGHVSGGDASRAAPSAAATADIATIDRMTTGIPSYSYHEYGGPIRLFGSARLYTLSDGSSWTSDSGSYYDKVVYLDHVEVDGSTVRYVFRPPSDGITYGQTDFDAGDHSAQGTLGAPSSIVLEATIGSIQATMSGSVPLLSNDPTYYGEPRFNYYSTIPGAQVPFQLNYVIFSEDGWQPDSFSHGFPYDCTGWVDFAHATSVPALSGLHIRGSAQLPPHTTAAYVAIARYANGAERDVSRLATWEIHSAGTASVVDGTVTTDVFDSDMEPLTPAEAYEVDDAKTVLGRRSGTVFDRDNWPTYQADERHTGYVAHRYDPSTFAERWSTQVSTAYALNPVAASEGRVFASVYWYSGQGVSLTTLDARDGAVLWTKDFGSVYSVNPPAWAYGNVYVQTVDVSSDGIGLHAFDASTGEEIFDAPFEAQFFRYYAPTIGDGGVYVNGGYYGGIYGFDAFSGARRWFHSLAIYDQWTPSLVGDSAYAYLGVYSPGLYIFDRATGATRTVIPDPHFVQNSWSMNLAPLVLENGDAVVINGNRILRFDVAGGRVAWERSEAFQGQPAYARGVLYAADAFRLVALDAASGDELWSWPVPSGFVRNSFVLTDSHLFLSTDSKVYAIDLATHATAWSYPAGGNLALADDNLYIARSNGLLTAIAAPPTDPAPPLAIEIRGPDTATELTSVPYATFVTYADGRVRERTQATEWSVQPSDLASIGPDGTLEVHELLYPSAEATLTGSFTEAGVTLTASKSVHLEISVTIPELIERNRTRAAALQSGVLTELDQALAHEEAILRVLGPPPAGDGPGPPDSFRSAIVKAIAAGENARASVVRAIQELTLAGPVPLPGTGPPAAPKTGGTEPAAGRRIDR